MADPLYQQTLQRIAVVDQRLAVLQKHGIATNALSSQLAFARSLAEQRQYDEAENLCDELLAAAAELVDRAGEDASTAGGDTPRPLTRPRTPAREPLTDRVRSVLENGLLEQIMAKRKASGSGDQGPVALHMKELVDQIGQAVATVMSEQETHARSETSRLRAAVKEALQERRDDPDTARLERALERVVGPQRTADEAMQQRIAKLQEDMHDLRQQLDQPTADAAVTARIQRAIDRSLERHPLPDPEQLSERLTRAIQGAFHQHAADRSQGLTTRIGRAVGAAVSDHDGDHDATLSQRVAEAVEQRLGHGTGPEDLTALGDRIVAGISSILCDLLPDDRLTDRIHRAVGDAINDQTPTAGFERPQADEEPEPSQAATPQVQPPPSGELQDLIEQAIQQAAATIPGFDGAAFGDELRLHLQQQLQAVADQLQTAFSQSLSHRSAELEARLAALIERIQELPLGDGIGPELQGEVRRQVEQALGVDGLRQAARDRAAQTDRGGLRSVLASGIRTPGDSTIYEIRPEDLARCDNAQHLVDAQVAEAIETMIDDLLDGVTSVLTNRYSQHLTGRILTSSSGIHSAAPSTPASRQQNDATPEAPASSPQEHDMPAQQEPAADGQEEYPPSPEEDESVLTKPVHTADTGTEAEADDEPIPQALNAAEDPLSATRDSINTAEPPADTEPANLDDEDASALIEAMLRELGDEPGNDQDDAPPPVAPPPSAELARDLLYELTAASIPEEASGPVQKPAAAGRHPIHDLSLTRGGEETSELIKDALRRGERLRPPTNTATPEAIQPTTDFPAPDTPRPQPVVTAGPPSESAPGSGTHGLDRTALRGLIVEELDRRLPTAAPTAGDFAEQLRAHLPELLQDQTIKQHLFAVLAYEMIVNPGLLGELAGIRSFLRQEVAEILNDQNRETQDESREFQTGHRE